ncbi:SGNH/GDSL hydrolase family protein [Magnetovibrio sp.]|uniref:SGNH/GDSL hydrolase family protein n=1 Tax=Magnetovibrio sp. TaxID=2024836 RepID=UPI002F9555C1
MKNIVNVALVILSTLVSFVTVEIGYRFYLNFDNHEKFFAARNREHPTFGLYDKSHWEYDKDFGFVYPPGREITYTGIRDGKVSQCNLIQTINERGNIGPIRGSYEKADLKVLVFGDSFPAFYVAGQTFPMRMQDILSERLNLDVHVVNFGRDGYGILQMFDLAAAKISEWKPDLVVFTFITDDLTRIRIWRTVTEINGESRVLTTGEPNPNPSIDRANDTFVLNAKANWDWCQENLKTQTENPLIRDLEFQYRRMAREAGYAFPDPYSLKYSFLLARVLTGDAYDMGEKEVFRIPKIDYNDYQTDQQFMKKVQIVKDTGVPMAIIHLPIYPEVIENKEMIPGQHDEELWASLERVTGQNVLPLTQYMPMPLKDAEKMNASPTNFHPSPWGMDLYANAIADALMKNGYLSQASAGRP